MTIRCSAEDCDRVATTVLEIEDLPGHIHDCDLHAAQVREWCRVLASYPMPCPLPCSEAPIATATPTAL